MEREREEVLDILSTPGAKERKIGMDLYDR